MRIALACLLSVFVAACGDDGGSTTTDGGGSGSADAAPPMANCTPLDLASAPTVTIMNGTVTPNAQGGTVTAGTYQLSSVKLSAGAIQVTGTAKARMEIVSGTATTGAARVALILDGMAFGNPIQQNVNGAGLYTLAGPSLNLAEGCGGSNPLAPLTYTAAGTMMTIWTSYMVTDPIALNVPIELVLAIE
jgi:hypothetical protein